MKYRTIVADPPWDIEWHGGGIGRHHSIHGLGYSSMSMDDICALPVEQKLAADDATLFLWVTAPLNREGAGVMVARAWGFRPVGEFIWDKGMRIAGYFPRVCHEVMLVCKRGNPELHAASYVSSVQRWPAVRRHSQKPEAAMDLIEQVSPGPYVELFARRHRMGWDVWGNESANTASLEIPA